MFFLGFISELQDNNFDFKIFFNFFTLVSIIFFFVLYFFIFLLIYFLNLFFVLFLKYFIFLFRQFKHGSSHFFLLILHKKHELPYLIFEFIFFLKKIMILYCLYLFI